MTTWGMEDEEEDESEPDFEPLEAPAGYINTRRILSMFGRSHCSIIAVGILTCVVTGATQLCSRVCFT